MIGRLVAAALLVLPALWGESAVQHLLEDKMFARIRDYDAAMPGALGVATIDLTSGRVFVYNGEAVFPTASSIKIPIMVELFRAARRGEVRLTDSVTLTASDAVGGSGVLARQLAEGPRTLTVLELIKAMIESSDNTATNRCIAIARMDRVNRMLAAQGFREIRLRRIMMDSAAARRGDENVASPVEMARFVEQLYRGRLAPPGDTSQMIDILELVKADMRAAIPADVRVASKPGELPGVQCETGIVYLPGRPFVISVFTTFIGDNVHPVRDITKFVYDYFAKLAESNEYGNRTGR